MFRRRKFSPLLKTLKMYERGKAFHAFRHFNVSLMDALRVPLKTIQERVGHSMTGVFTLDVYGGQPEWGRNVEAVQMLGAVIAKSVKTLENSHSLTTGNENGSQSRQLEAADN